MEPAPAEQCRLEDSFSAGYQALRLTGMRPYAREVGPSQTGVIRRSSDFVAGESAHPSAVEAIGKPFAGNSGSKHYQPRNLVDALDAGLPVWQPDYDRAAV